MNNMDTEGKSFSSDRSGNSGTKEWSDHSFNAGLGCSHNCLYCYARADALRYRRIDSAEEWETETVNAKVAEKSAEKFKGVVMYPTIHDITPAYLEISLQVVKNLLEKGNKLLVVSKPHLDCIKDICKVAEPWKDNLLLRFTLSSFNDELCRLWEPGAPSPSERLAALRHAYANGFGTSVSMEPMIDSGVNTIDAVEVVQQYVTDTIWIGKMNQVKLRVKGKSPETAEAIKRIEAQQTDGEIMRLVMHLEGNPKVQWKESIKQVIARYSARTEYQKA